MPIPISPLPPLVYRGYFFDARRGRKPSALGFCIGAVVGLVAITPAAGFVGLPQSCFIGFISAIISNLAVHWKGKTTIDDTLDVFFLAMVWAV